MRYRVDCSYMERVRRTSPLAVAALPALAALIACSSNGNSANTAGDSANTAAATGAAMATEAAAPAGGGQQVYATNCASCHQSNGQGVPGAFPPLAGNAAVTGDPKTVIHIVKYGLSGKIAVGNATYNGMMPPWGSQLSDAQIASVVTYVRSAWGNHGAPVTTIDVTAVPK